MVLLSRSNIKQKFHTYLILYYKLKFDGVISCVDYILRVVTPELEGAQSTKYLEAGAGRGRGEHKYER